MDKVKPLKIETLEHGSQDDEGYQTEANPAEDYLACKGIAFENLDTHTIDIDPVTGSLRFLDPVNGSVTLTSLGGIQVYTTVSSLEGTVGTQNKLTYCVETETFYRYETNGSSYIDDDKYVLTTGNGGNTRYLGVAGQYIVAKKCYNFGNRILR